VQSGRSLVWLGHQLATLSNIQRTEVDWDAFKEYVFKKYAESWAKNVYYYAKKYVHLIDNPSLFEAFSSSKKDNVLKSLIAFSKFHGFYRLFKERIKNYGITWSHRSSVDSFFRIMSDRYDDVLK
jgi:hypothetical protein